jgi:hypothetical protein
MLHKDCTVNGTPSRAVAAADTAEEEAAEEEEAEAEEEAEEEEEEDIPERSGQGERRSAVR